ncbi:hypothetical protein V8F20_003135, partial [Naviculisporaceae sp. PSN 640]
MRMKSRPVLLPLLALLTAEIQVVLAVHIVTFISLHKYIQLKTNRPDAELFSLRNFNKPEARTMRQGHGWWFERVSDAVKYPKALGPCRPSGPLDYPFTSPNSERVNNYPLFPLDEASRNKILGRPPPEVVTENIRIATRGEVKTVTELVDLSYNLGLLIPHGDDVLTLLASNFHQPTAGFIFNFGCGRELYPAQGGLWPEDMLVSQDEQRALIAAAMFVLSDEEYITRRLHEQDTAMRQQEKKVERTKAVETCEQQMKTGTDLFRERVDALNRDILMREEDWVARYDALVASLRAELYAMAPRETWIKVESSIEEVVAGAEEMVGEMIMETVKCLVRQSYDEYGYGFHRFVPEEIKVIRDKYQPLVLSKGVMSRIAYWRW